MSDPLTEHLRGLDREIARQRAAGMDLEVLVAERDVAALQGQLDAASARLEVLRERYGALAVPATETPPEPPVPVAASEPPPPVAESAPEPEANTNAPVGDRTAAEEHYRKPVASEPEPPPEPTPAGPSDEYRTGATVETDARRFDMSTGRMLPVRKREYVRFAKALSADDDALMRSAPAAHLTEFLARYGEHSRTQGD